MSNRSRPWVRRLHHWELRKVQSLARRTWEEELFHDTGVRMAYPLRPLSLYEAYLGSDPKGCLVTTIENEPMAAAYAHSWGSIGWIGPLEVDPRYQGQGYGTQLVRACVRYLRGEGCEHIGLEANGENHASMDFYHRLGFREQGPAPFYEKELGKKEMDESGEDILEIDDLADELLEIQHLLEGVSPGLDLSNELWMAAAGLGSVIRSSSQGKISGLAILHRPLVPELKGNLLRCLLIDPKEKAQGEILHHLLARCEQVSAGWGSERLFFSSVTGENSFHILRQRGYREMGRNVRLVIGEAMPLRGEHHLISWSG